MGGGGSFRRKVQCCEYALSRTDHVAVVIKLCVAVVVVVLFWGSRYRIRGRGLLGCIVAFTHYTERYVERFPATPCSEKLVSTHNVSLRIREDLSPRR